MIVGVQHDHYVGAVTQRFHVAGLLVATISDIMRVANNFYVHMAGDFAGVIFAAVVDQNNFADQSAWDFVKCLQQRLVRVVRRHGDDSLGGARFVSQTNSARRCLCVYNAHRKVLTEYPEHGKRSSGYSQTD